MVQVKWMAAGLLAMGAMGCAGAGQTYAPSKPAAVFPTRAELEAIAPKEVTAEAFDLGNVQVETWNYGSAAGPDGPYQDSSPWAPILAKVIQAAPPGQLRLSGALRCAAEETARFHLKHGNLPSASWRRFTAARCGSPSPNVSIVSHTFELPEGVTDAQVVATIPPNFAYEMAKPLHATNRHLTAGLAAVREGKRLAVGIVFARDTVQVDASSYHADAQRRVTVRGTLVGEPAEHISGLINRGRYGVGHCDTNPAVAPPAFDLECQMAEGDKWAWIDVTARAKDRVLSTQVGSLIVSAAGEEPPVQYGAPRGAGASSVVNTPAEFRSALASRLNAVRGAARLSPLQLSVEQSAFNERLVGVLLDTQSKEAAKANWSDFGSGADRAAIGVLAGWDVRGLIRDGTVFVASAPETRDATAWLDLAIEHPMGRETLLAPESRVLAIGPAIPKSANALGAVVTTYALFEGDDHSAEADRVFSAISSARTQRGLPAPMRLTNVPGFAEKTALVRDGKKQPSEAFNETLEYIAEHLPGERIQGLFFETLDVERLVYPKEVFRPGPMQLVVEVTHHRAPGAAWGQYVVYLFLRSSAGKAAGYDARAETHRAAF
ncbi:hypothetical protein LZC95_30915 [Pendulispora brunnea]|uniref:Lipoprotein n=1 Tax=Pendulispora brunnea TaxID=2905690 RepID=A0ABZ2JWI6_9BACT